MFISDNTNKATIDCPMTGQEEQVAICAFKRNRVYRGKSSGNAVCNCSIHAGRCVVTRAMQSPQQKVQDAFTSSTERKLNVPQEILAAVFATIVPTEVLSRFPDMDIEDKERLMHVVPRNASEKKEAKKAKK